MAGTLIIQPFANTGDKIVPPQTDAQGFVNFTDGYTPDYEINLTISDPQAKAVERAIQNALFNLLTANQQEWQLLGFSEWYSTMPGGYKKNSQVVRLNTGVWFPYRSLVDNNVSDPLTTPAQWEYVPSATELISNIPMRAGGAAGSTAEIVTVATDFNTFTTGTWELRSDAIATASANSPPPPGGTTLAGVLESKAWGSGAPTYIVQRYTDRAGNGFFRGNVNGVWSAWSTTIPQQKFGVDGSAAANTVSANFAFSTASIDDNRAFWVKIANTNTGDSSFSPNPTVFPGLRQILGQGGFPLQGGELVAGGRALIIYRLDINKFVLVTCTGGQSQVVDATQSHQATSLGQVQTLIAAASASADAILYRIGAIF